MNEQTKGHALNKSNSIQIRELDFQGVAGKSRLKDNKTYQRMLQYNIQNSKNRLELREQILCMIANNVVMYWESW